MKNIFYLALVSLFIFSCTDPEKDPLRIADIKKGSYIALRGTAYSNLYEDAFLGGVDTFAVTGDASKETFEFEADYLSEDQSTLASVDIYAKYNSSGTLVKITNIPGSTFVAPTGATTRRGKITIPLNDILSKTGKKLSDIAPADPDNGIINKFVIQCDVNLTDGTIVKASSIVNSSLYESDLFYPAHFLNYVAK